MGRRRNGILAALIAAAAAAVCAPSALAATPITDSFGECPAYGDVQICSGQVPSFDGSKLDVDLTLPTSGGSGPHPLIVMLHGFGNNKHEWESTTDAADDNDKWHWNSHWFAGQGYYVLTYTARGFRDDGPYEEHQPDTPSFSSAELPSGTLHLKSREFEIRDTQWLAALVADSYDVDPQKVAVTGGSYGGGESWVQASQAQWKFPHEQDSSLPVLDLQVAVPKYPWTDLAYSLAPNGHGGGPSGSDLYESAQGKADSDTGSGNPVGVPKASYVTGFFALGNEQGIFEQGTTTTPSEEGPINVPAWNARVIGQGDPYDAGGVDDPVVAQVRRGLTEYRSAYYQDEGWQAQAAGDRRVAVFSIQGWTDDLFPALESFRQFKYLKRLNPRWPVAVAVADVGHSRAQNRDDVWHSLNNQANQWLSSNIGGSNDQTTTVASQQSTCPNDTDPANNVTAGNQLTAGSPEGLAAGTLTVKYAGAGTLPPGGGTGDPDGGATDPAFGGSVFGHTEPCRESDAPTHAGRYTAVSSPLKDTSTYIGLGHVALRYSWAGDTSAAINARLWDVEPGGKTLLISRGTYRLDAPSDPSAGTLRLPLFGNHWRLGGGHRLRLDLTQVDEPTFRRSQVADSISFTPPQLTLPIREKAKRIVGGA